MKDWLKRNKTALSWTWSIGGPLLLAFIAAWERNFDALCGWLCCFIWVCIAGLRELHDVLEEAEEECFE